MKKRRLIILSSSIILALFLVYCGIGVSPTGAPQQLTTTPAAAVPVNTAPAITATGIPAPTQTTAQPTEFDLDQYLKNLTNASYAFNSAPSMQVGTIYKVHLIISPSEPKTKLETAVAQPGGNVESGSVQVDTLMAAYLKGANFKIEPITPEEQAVSFQERTEWIWEVTPLQEGKQLLYLSIYAKILMPGTQTQRQIKTLEHEIQVSVTFGQRVAGFAKDNWQWLWTAIFIPAAGYGISRFTKKKQSHQPPALPHLKHRN